MAVRSVETTGPAETESLGAELAAGSRRRRHGAGARRARLGQDDARARRRPRARRERSRDQPDVQHRPPLRGRRRDGLPPRSLPAGGLEREDPALLADYLGPGRIAFVEWPQEEHAELAGARLRVTLSHGGGDRRRIEVSEPTRLGVRRPGGPAGSRWGRAAMIVLGLDTATPRRRSRCASPTERRVEARDDPARRRAPGPRDAAAGDGRRAARAAPASAGARSTGSRSGVGPGTFTGPARRRRHRARAGAVAGGRAGRRLEPAGARARGRRGVGAGGAERGARRDRRAPRRGVRRRLPRRRSRACRASWPTPRALAPEELARRRSRRPSRRRRRAAALAGASATARCAFARSSSRLGSRVAGGRLAAAPASSAAAICELGGCAPRRVSLEGSCPTTGAARTRS